MTCRRRKSRRTSHDRFCSLNGREYHGTWAISSEFGAFDIMAAVRAHEGARNARSSLNAARVC